MDDEPADESEVTDRPEVDGVETDDLVERRARVRAVLDGHPVAAAAPKPSPPRLELLR